MQESHLRHAYVLGRRHHVAHGSLGMANLCMMPDTSLMCFGTVAAARHKHIASTSSNDLVAVPCSSADFWGQDQSIVI